METLKPGQTASIVDVSGESAVVHRLAEMGIRCGSQVLVKDPGEPMRLAVDGKDVVLRCGSSVLILVTEVVGTNNLT